MNGLDRDLNPSCLDSNFARRLISEMCVFLGMMVEEWVRVGDSTGSRGLVVVGAEPLVRGE